MTRPARLDRILPFLGLTVFLDLVGFGIILPLLPSYIAEMGGSAQTVGVLLASFAATQLVATPVLGRLSDQHGRRRVIVLSLAANVVAMLLFALAAHRHALWLLFMSRMVAGATSGNIGACQATIADVSEGPERVRAMGKLGAGIGLGMMLGPWIGGRASQFGSAAPPLFAGAMAFIALVGVMIFLPETNPAVVSPSPGSPGSPGSDERDGADDAHHLDPHHLDEARTSVASIAPLPPASTPALVAKKRPRLSFAVLTAHPKIALVVALYFLTFLYMTNLQTGLALLAAERFHWTRENVSNLFGLFGLVTLIMQFGVVGPLSARATPGSVLTGAALIAMMGLLAIGFSPIASGMVFGLILLASAVGLTQPQLAGLASQYAGKAGPGTVLGLAQSSGSLARALGPLLWGSLYQHLGPTASFAGGAIAAVVASFIALGARPKPHVVSAR
jgi:MFS family permease